ncbi:MAG TPA: hypothetical protein VGU66_11840 [Candidatus Elarobacter sp.]|nr:hypothetical protein [Candidatus Elarobacter sp.]
MRPLFSRRCENRSRGAATRRAIPPKGGYGLPIVAEEADYLAIRTGDALLDGQSLRDERGELVLTARPVVALDGTLVVATVSTQK